MKYVCTAPVELDSYDDEGFCTEETTIVQPGEVFDLDETEYREIGGPGTVRLIQDRGLRWLEILPETLQACFREVQEDG